MAKIDLSGVKHFFFDKGEKIALVACLAAMGVFVGYGVSSGLSARFYPNSTNSYVQTLKSVSQGLKSKYDGGESVPALAFDGRGPEWADQVPVFKQGRYWDFQERHSTKRLNPRALPILADQDKYFQMDYYRGPYFAYEINPLFKTATVAKDPTKPNAPNPKDPFNPFKQPTPKTPNAQAAAQAPVITIQPRRMLVVSAVFPLNDQIEEFRKAFRMMTQAELFAKKEDLPKFLGLIVMKAEITPGQTSPVWTPLIRHNFQKDVTEFDPALQSMLREALWDESQVFASSIQGLTMPMPKLAALPPNNVYPEIKLPNILTLAENLGGTGVKGPMGGGPAMTPGTGMPAVGKLGADVEFDNKVRWDLLAPDLRDKFFDKFYALDPSGFNPDPDEGKSTANSNKNTGTPSYVSTANNTNAVHFQGLSNFSAINFWNRYPAPPMPAGVTTPTPGPLPQPGPMGTTPLPKYDALVRFVDVDVKPGKMYKYSIQVRIANPNYGKKSDVAYAQLADVRELTPAAPVETPIKEIPEEYAFYAIDQKPDNPKIVGGSDDKDAKPDQVAIQVHRWVDRTSDINTGTDYVIGDWAIAERLLLRRGDPIARAANIEIPVWDKKKATYELGLSTVGENVMNIKPKQKVNMPVPKKVAPVKPGTAEIGSVGIPVDFAETNPPAVLADFDGGKRTIPGTQIKDESASNLLILGADGKLTVRNSRIDSEPDTTEYKERQQRIEDWKAKVTPLRAVQANPNGVGPMGVNPNNPFNKKN